MALGHLFVELEEIMVEEHYFRRVVEALKPCLEFYQSEKGGSETWQLYLQMQDFPAWRTFMEQVFKEYTAVAVPARVPVSVVICTRNRARQLHQCLLMLQKLTCLPSEIIVIDNAPIDDDTQEVTGQFSTVTYVREPRIGLDIARNTGVDAASFPIVAFVDDDVQVDPLWVYHVWKTFDDPETAAMTGLVIASELETEAQYIFEKFWSFNRGYTDVVYGSSFFNKHLHHGPPVWRIGAGANMAFRKAVFEEVGKFDEILDVGAAGCNGDSEMWYRILANGYKIHYNPRAVVFHEHRNELKNLRKQIFFYMRGFTTAALLQQKQLKEANYKKRLFRYLPKHYCQLIIRGFPRYRSRNRTLWAEIKGILSGYLFYLRNNKKSSVVGYRNSQKSKKLNLA